MRKYLSLTLKVLGGLYLLCAGGLILSHEFAVWYYEGHDAMAWLNSPFNALSFVFKVALLLPAMGLWWLSDKLDP